MITIVQGSPGKGMTLELVKTKLWEYLERERQRRFVENYQPVTAEQLLKEVRATLRKIAPKC